jgi:tungstate transport system substrate-binding protein
MAPPHPRLGALAAPLLLALSAACSGEPKPTAVVRLATTTSARDTGLLDVLLPAFGAESGFEVRPVAVGTGEALKLGERGDADVVLVHARAAEDEFLAKGFGVERHEVWWNRFLVVGPASDPAGVAAYARDAKAAFARIRDARAAFVSRGDDSGTHQKELSLWGTLSAWDGYVEVGQGMSGTLRVADEKDAYTLCDEGTFLRLRGDLRLKPLVTADPALRNPYGVILVRPMPGADANNAAARRFFEWLSSPAALDRVKAFTIEGERPFFLPGEEPR